MATSTGRFPPFAPELQPRNMNLKPVLTKEELIPLIAEAWADWLEKSKEEGQLRDRWLAAGNVTQEAREKLDGLLKQLHILSVDRTDYDKGPMR